MKVTSVVMLVLFGAFELHGTEAVSGSEIARVALSHVGSTKWSFAAFRLPNGRNWNKCNIFVADVLKKAAKKVIAPQRRIYPSPIGTGEWENPSSSYLTEDTCWTYSRTPGIGYVAGYDGHVGIVTGPEETTSGRSDRIVTNDWGFRTWQTSVAFWRYIC